MTVTRRGPRSQGSRCRKKSGWSAQRRGCRQRGLDIGLAVRRRHEVCFVQTQEQDRCCIQHAVEEAWLKRSLCRSSSRCRSSVAARQQEEAKHATFAVGAEGHRRSHGRRPSGPRRAGGVLSVRGVKEAGAAGSRRSVAQGRRRGGHRVARDRVPCLVGPRAVPGVYHPRACRQRPPAACRRRITLPNTGGRARSRAAGGRNGPGRW